MKNIRKLVIFLVAFAAIGGLIMAQGVNAKLEGVVTDTEGGPLPGVTVIASSPTMVGTASTVTDENGKYRLLGSPQEPTKSPSPGRASPPSPGKTSLSTWKRL